MAGIGDDPLIYLLTPEQVWEAKEDVGRLLRRATRKSGYDWRTIFNGIMNQNSMLWMINDFQAIVVARLINRDTERVLFIEWLAGDGMDEWLEEWEQMQSEFAKYSHCTAIEFQGRKGWEKINEQYQDYKPVRTIYRKEISWVA